MKPLNRPMFRYGGPIKEGVMSGIREPHKNGNIVGGHQSPKLAGAHPLKDASGREHHLIPAGMAIGAGLQALGRFALRPLGRYVASRVPKMFSGPKRTFEIGKGYGSTPGYTKKVADVSFKPTKLGQAFIDDPLAKTVMGGTSLVGRGIKSAGKGIYNVGKYATTTPSGLTFLGAPVAYQAGKYFLSDGTEIKGDDIKNIKQEGPPGGGETALGTKEAYLTPKVKKGGGVELTAEELRKKNVERYRDIMDIKGMNKKAAYNSLIEASRLINESGDFKGDIKSGKLINQIIGATSKQFDKPSQTKDAIDTLILKGEIEKDIKASDPKAQRQADLLEKQIQIADKTLAGDSFTDIITERYKKGKVPRGNELAGILRATEKVDVTVFDSTNIPQGVDAQTFFESQVNEKISKGEAVNPGYYVISDRVLVVDEQGKVTPIL